MEYNKKMGEKIKLSRIEAKLTQQGLGKAIGRSGAAIAYLEKGQRIISPDILYKIAEATGKPVSFYYEGDDKKICVESAVSLLQRQAFELKQALDFTEEKKRDADNKKTMFYQAFQHSNDSIIISNNRGEIIYYNSASELLFGYNADEVENNHISMLCEDPNIGTEIVMPLVMEQGSWSGEVVRKRKDGSVFVSHLKVSLIRGANNMHLGAIGITRDISEEKKFAKQLAQFQELINQSGDGICIVNAEDGSILYANSKACDMFACTQDEICSLDVKDFDSERNGLGWKESVGRLKENGSLLIPRKVQTKDGKEFNVELSLKIVPLDEKEYVVAIFHENNGNNNVPA